MPPCPASLVHYEELHPIQCRTVHARAASAHMFWPGYAGSGHTVVSFYNYLATDTSTCHQNDTLHAPFCWSLSVAAENKQGPALGCMPLTQVFDSASLAETRIAQHSVWNKAGCCLLSLLGCWSLKQRHQPQQHLSPASAPAEFVHAHDPFLL